MNIKHSIFLLLIMASCSSLNIDQKVVFQQKDEIGLSNLILNKNGRFYYSFDPLTIFQETKGKYEIIKNNLYLQSDSMYIAAKDTLIVTEKLNIRREIKIKGIGEFSEIFINNDTIANILNKGEVLILPKEKKIDSLTIDSFLKIKYYPKNQKEYSYSMILNFANHDKIYFDNEKFIIKNKRIIINKNGRVFKRKEQ